MIFYLTILFQFSSSIDFPETKNLRGGVFTWPSGLAWTRKMWKWVKIPHISFNYTDLNVEKLTKQLTAGKINYNLTRTIQNTISNLFNENNATETITKKGNKLSSFIKTKINQYTNKINNINIYNENDRCDEIKYPNAYYLNIDPNQFDCQLVNDLLGQIYSYAFIVMPLAAIFIFTIIFYIVFCFGRCCCYKPKSRSKPNKTEIIFFSIISLFLMITIIFFFAATVYLIGIMKYVLKDEFQDEVEGVCTTVNPSVNKGLTKFVNSIIPSISNISGEIVSVIDRSLPNLVKVLNNTGENMNLFSQIMIDIEKFGDSVTPSLQSYEQSYSQCASSETSSSTCPREISFLSDIKFGSIGDIFDLLSSFVSAIADIIDVSSSVDEGKQVITDSIDNIEESIFEFSDVTVFEDCNFSEFFEPVKEIPSYVLPLATAFLVIFPIVMLIIFAFQICAFWTKGRCARCCSVCCLPCVFWASLIFVLGSIPTFMSFVVIFCNIFYDQGDDALDTVIKSITTDDKIIEFGNVNLSSFTKGIVGSFRLEDIKLQKIEFFKNLIDAKINTPLSQIISFHQLPFNNIADMIEYSLANAAKAIHLDTFIIDPINDVIDSAFENLPDLNLDEIANTDQMKSKLSEISHSISCCNSQFNSLNNGYTDFFSKFDLKIKSYAEQRNNVDRQLRKVPENVGKLANDLFGGLLKTIGGTFSSAFRHVAPSLDKFELNWAIGAFNVIRVRFLYKFMSAMMYASIAAHLYLVGMVAMSMLLWIRRSGMGREDQYSNIGAGESESYKSTRNNNRTKKYGSDQFEDDSLYSNLID